MTAAERKQWISRVKQHLDVRLKEAIREGLKAYWPVSEVYDPEATEAAKEIYAKMKGALAKALRGTRL
jgi:hypothetical protein